MKKNPVAQHHAISSWRARPQLQLLLAVHTPCRVCGWLTMYSLSWLAASSRSGMGWGGVGWGRDIKIVKRRLRRCSSWKFLDQALNPTGLVVFVIARIQFKPLIIPKLRLTKKGQCCKTSFDSTTELNWTELKLNWNRTDWEVEVCVCFREKLEGGRG